MSVQDLSTKVYRSVTTVVLASTHRTDQRYSVNICYKPHLILASSCPFKLSVQCHLQINCDNFF